MSFLKPILEFFTKKEEKTEKRKYTPKVKKRFKDLPKSFTGSYKKKHLDIKKVIRQISKEYEFNASYIGATEDLDTRWGKYPDWELKHVLYETSSVKNARFVEEKLIEYTDKINLICNKDTKSKGLKEGAVKYYVYILADYTCQLRN